MGPSSAYPFLIFGNPSSNLEARVYPFLEMFYTTAQLYRLPWHFLDLSKNMSFPFFFFSALKHVRYLLPYTLLFHLRLHQQRELFCSPVSDTMDLYNFCTTHRSRHLAIRKFIWVKILMRNFDQQWSSILELLMILVEG